MRRRFQKKATKTTAAPGPVRKGRVVKDHHLPSPPTKERQSKAIPIIKPRESQPRKRPIELLLPKVPIPSPTLTEPKAWWASLVASIPGAKKAAPIAPEQAHPEAPPGPSKETATQTTAKQALQPSISAVTKPPQQPAASVAPKKVSQPTLNAVKTPLQQPDADILQKNVSQPAVGTAAKHSPQPEVNEGGSVSVAYLISLGIKISLEQLRAIAAQNQKVNHANEDATSMDRPIKETSPAKKQNLPNSANSTTVDAKDGVKAPETQSPLVSKASKSTIPTAHTAPSLTTAKENIVPTVVNPFAGKSPSEEIAYPTSRSDMLRRQREMIIGSQVYKNRYSQVAGILVDSFQKMTLTDLSPPSSPTYQFDPIASKSATHAPVPSSPTTSVASVVTSTVSCTAADPLVSKALAGSRPPATVSKAVASTGESTKTVSPHAPTPPPAAPLLRPKFITDGPIAPSTVPSPAPLAARTTNPPLAVVNPFAPTKKTRRPAGPALPPHLMGKSASSDPGAAARAQYGG